MGVSMQTYNKKYWPYQIRITPNEHQLDHWELVADMQKFCYDHFKSGNWRNNGLYFVFKRQSDATFFSLRHR